MSTQKKDGAKERIAKMRSLGMEISPAMEIIILKECEFAYTLGTQDAIEKASEKVRNYLNGLDSVPWEDQVEEFVTSLKDSL